MKEVSETMSNAFKVCTEGKTTHYILVALVCLWLEFLDEAGTSQT